MFDSFPGSNPEFLERDRYHEDFRRHLQGGIGSLEKLERGQHFREKGFASWEAFAAGEWGRSLSLIEEKRDIYAQQLQSAADRGITRRRLRVVEFPVTPYVQWEFHVLRLRVELGDQIRVLDAATIPGIERNRPVPEVVILGDAVMYEVIYNSEGDATGANRYTDSALIEETSAGFDTLYDRGEGFSEFFTREISPLAPPLVNS